MNSIQSSSRPLFHKIALVGVLFVLGAFHAASVSAAQVGAAFVAPQTVHVGDTFFVDYLVTDTADAINVVEGSVNLKNMGVIEPVTISTGNSSFGVWAQKPVFNKKGDLVTFTAGTTKPFVPNNALVMRLVLRALKPGTASFSQQSTLYAADGRGTAIKNNDQAAASVLVLEKQTAVNDVWKTTLQSDTTPPAPFQVMLGSHFSLFQNRIFATFETTDAGSGVSYYEIKEGDSGYVPAESPYLLQHQRTPVVVTVRAVDMARNERLSVVVPSRSHKIWYMVAPVVVAVIGLGIYLALWITRRRKAKR